MNLRDAIGHLLTLCLFQIEENKHKGTVALRDFTESLANEVKSHELKRQRAMSDTRKREYAADVACCIAFYMHGGHYFEKQISCEGAVQVMFSWTMRDCDSPEAPTSAFREPLSIDDTIGDMIESFKLDNGMASTFAREAIEQLAVWLANQDLLYPPRAEDHKPGVIQSCDVDWY